MNIISLITKNRKYILFFFIIIILLAALPFYWPGYTVLLVTSIFMYIILSVSWTLFCGPTGYMSLATAAFFGVGVYSTAFLGEIFCFPAVIITAGLVSFLLAMFIGVITLRLKSVYFAMFTFGIVALMSNLVLYLELTITGTRGRFIVTIDQNIVYYYMLALLLLLLLVTYMINRSRYGLALKAMGQNEEAAAHIGINVTMLKIITFAISALFMGAAGSVMATRWSYIDSSIAFNFDYTFMPALMSIFGGMGQIYGVIAGSVIFSYLEEFLLTKLPELFRLIFGIIMVISILYMKDGISGLIEKWRKDRLNRLGEKNANS
ncbi:MAG: branched-chain amino acid ABC transporter permease [Spirochaetes bacterium]|nr:branched-chain amino acid ABC transporter permease [Spirochaetota bacterium]